MLRKSLLLAALLTAGCSYEHFLRYPLSDEQVEQATPAAAHELDCSEGEIHGRYRTLLTRTMEGCDRQAVFAYDWMLDRWWGDFQEDQEPAAQPPDDIQ